MWPSLSQHSGPGTGTHWFLSTIYPCVANYLGNMFCVDIFFPLIMTHIEFEVPTDSFHRTYLCCVLCWETTQAGEAAKCWLCCSGREEEERCSMKILHIHRLASVTSAAPDTAAAGHMTYLTHAQVPSGFSCTDDYLPSSPAHWVHSALQHCRLVRGVQVQTVPFIMCSTDCSTAEIISDINHAITSTHHRQATLLALLESENMLLGSIKNKIKLNSLWVR